MVIMRHLLGALAGLGLLAGVTATAQAAAERVTVTGEVIDSWCYITEIMYPLGTAHHQCAIWCAAHSPGGEHYRRWEQRSGGHSHRPARSRNVRGSHCAVRESRSRRWRCRRS